MILRYWRPRHFHCRLLQIAAALCTNLRALDHALAVAVSDSTGLPQSRPTRTGRCIAMQKCPDCGAGFA